MKRFGTSETICHGRYRLGAPKGEGKTAYTLLARDLLVGEDVLCKIGPLGGETERHKFQGLWRKLRSIRSPDVVQALGYDEHEVNGRIFPVLIQEIAPGENIIDWFREKNAAEKLRALCRVTSATAALHEARVVHGDLTAGNVLATDHRVTLIDPEVDDPSEEDVTFSGAARSRRPDREQLLELLTAAFPDSLPTILGPVAASLGNDLVPLSSIATSMWSTLAVPELGVDARRHLEAYATAYAVSTTEAQAQYIHLRETRHLEFEKLHRRVSDLLTGSGARADRIDVGGIADERLGDRQALPALSSRGILVQAPRDPRRLIEISLRGANGRPKPWLHDEPGLYAKGSFKLLLDGSPFLSELALVGHGDGVIWLVTEPGSEKTLLTEDWLGRQMLKLLQT